MTLIPRPRPTQFEALVEWEDEMHERERQRGAEDMDISLGDTLVKDMRTE